MLQRPAQVPTKKLFEPVPPPPLKQLTMFVVLQTAKTLDPPPPPPVNTVPLIHNPESSTRSLSHDPVAIINVEVIEEVAMTLPIIVLLAPVVIANPELHPIKILLLPHVLQ